MKPDWKALSACEGYLSLKAAFAALHAEQNQRDQKHNGSYVRFPKQKLRYLFTKVIDRAKHIQCKTGMLMEDVLLGWEIDRKSRSYDLVNYYSSMTNEAFANKIPKHHKKPLGARGLRKMVWRDYSDKATRMSVYKRRKRRLIVRV